MRFNPISSEVGMSSVSTPAAPILNLHKRTYAATTMTVVNFNKKQKIEHVDNQMIVNVIRIGEDQEIEKNHVWLNRHDFKVLFCLDDHSPEEMHYIQVANHVYRAVIKDWMPKKTMGMNVLQINACESVLFHYEGGRSIFIKKFTPHGVKKLDSAVFEIIRHDEIKNPKPLAEIDITLLRSTMHKNYSGQFFKQQQNLFIAHPHGPFTACLKKIPNECQKKEKDEKDEKEDFFDTFQQMQPDTILDFYSPSVEQITLFEDAPGIVSCFYFFISLSREFPQNNFNNPLNRINFSLNLRLLSEKIREQLMGQKLFHGHKLNFAYDNLYYQLELIDIKLQNNGNLLSLPIPPTPYKPAYQMFPKSEIIFKPSAEIILTSDQVLEAEKLAFSIVSVQNYFDIQANNKTVITIDELRNAVQNWGKPFVNQQFLEFEFQFGKIKLKLERGVNASQSQLEERIYQGIGTSWACQATTKITFYPKTGVEIVIVENLNPINIKSIEVKVEAAFPNVDDLIILEENFAKQMFLLNCPMSLYKQHTLFSNTERGEVIKFTIREIELENSNLIPFEYETLGKIGKNTKIKFYSGSGGGIILTNIPVEINLSNYQEKLRECGLGGISKQFKEVIDRILLARTCKDELHLRSITPPRGLLLYGPPGTGKTTLARNLGALLGCDAGRIKEISGSEIWNMWLGNSEKHIRELFAPANSLTERFKEKSPLYLIIIDEIDSFLTSRTMGIAEHRNSVIDQFLASMDGLKTLNNILVVGITNYKDRLDAAALRPGRFDVQLEIGLPETAGRLEIFKIHAKKMINSGLLSKDIKMEEWAQKTTKWSGADIKGLLDRAGLFSVSRLEALRISGNVNITNNEDLNGLEGIEHKTERNEADLEKARKKAGMVTQKDLETAFEQLKVEWSKDDGNARLFYFM